MEREFQHFRGCPFCGGCPHGYGVDGGVFSAVHVCDSVGCREIVVQAHSFNELCELWNERA
jgi:hypothetical protein